MDNQVQILAPQVYPPFPDWLKTVMARKTTRAEPNFLCQILSQERSILMRFVGLVVCFKKVGQLVLISALASFKELY